MLKTARLKKPVGATQRPAFSKVKKKLLIIAIFGLLFLISKPVIAGDLLYSYVVAHTNVSWNNLNWDGDRIFADVLSGNYIDEFRFYINPTTTGTYDFNWDMIQDSNSIATGTENITISGTGQQWIYFNIGTTTFDNSKDIDIKIQRPSGFDSAFRGAVPGTTADMSGIVNNAINASVDNIIQVYGGTSTPPTNGNGTTTIEAVPCSFFEDNISDISIISACSEIWGESTTSPVQTSRSFYYSPFLLFFYISIIIWTGVIIVLVFLVIHKR